MCAACKLLGVGCRLFHISAFWCSCEVTTWRQWVSPGRYAYEVSPWCHSLSRGSEVGERQLYYPPETKRHLNNTKTDHLPMLGSLPALLGRTITLAHPNEPHVQKNGKFGEIPVPPTKTWVEGAARQNPLQHRWTARLRGQEKREENYWRNRISKALL